MLRPHALEAEFQPEDEVAGAGGAEPHPLAVAAALSVQLELDCDTAPHPESAPPDRLMAKRVVDGKSGCEQEQSQTWDRNEEQKREIRDTRVKAELLANSVRSSSSNCSDCSLVAREEQEESIRVQEAGNCFPLFSWHTFRTRISSRSPSPVRPERRRPHDRWFALSHTQQSLSHIGVGEASGQGEAWAEPVTAGTQLRTDCSLTVLTTSR